MTMITTEHNKMATSYRRRRRKISSDDPLLLSLLGLFLLVLLSCALLPIKSTTVLFVDGFSFVKVGTTEISPITKSSARQHFIDTVTSSKSSSSSSSSSSLVQLFASNNDNDDENSNSNNNKSNSFFAQLPSVFSTSSNNKNDDDITGVIGNDDDVDNDDDESSSKFDMAQRIESLKSIVLGAIAGGIGLTPIAYLHYVYFASATEPNGLAQWEFVTDMSSIEAGLFAIVYRYAIRKNDDNPMLNQGVVGAFIIVRSLSNIHVTETCKAIPLRCGPPLGYFDWNMITQGAWNGVESVALFGFAALAMEFAFQQKWISKFD